MKNIVAAKEATRQFPKRRDPVRYKATQQLARRLRAQGYYHAPRTAEWHRKDGMICKATWDSNLERYDLSYYVSRKKLFANAKAAVKGRSPADFGRSSALAWHFLGAGAEAVDPIVKWKDPK
jgi:hypothetical protein